MIIKTAKLIYSEEMLIDTQYTLDELDNIIYNHLKDKYSQYSIHSYTSFFEYIPETLCFNHPIKFVLDVSTKEINKEKLLNGYCLALSVDNEAIDLHVKHLIQSSNAHHKLIITIVWGTVDII